MRSLLPSLVLPRACLRSHNRFCPSLPFLLLLSFTSLSGMSAAARRNELPEEARVFEYLVQAKFVDRVAVVDDTGFIDTKWVSLEALAGLDDLEEAMEAWRDAEEEAREAFVAVAVGGADVETE